jgi:MFS family permease
VTGARGEQKSRLPRTVWALGLVSLFMDASSELIHGLLPVFMSVTLGASMSVIGDIEGVAEAIAQFGKLISGTLSDRFRTRKPWLVLGYGLSALTKPLFPLAGAIATVAAARFLDRIGKGFRDAPRDALLADVTPREVRGAAYGLRQGLDTVGAIVGPLAASGLIILYADNIRAALWWSLLPAALCVLTLVTFVREPEKRTPKDGEPRPSLRNAAALPFTFWIVTAMSGLLTLARFSDAFLILRGTSLGVPLAGAPIILVLMNIVYALSSYPAGAASDHAGRKALLAAGAFALIAADTALALAHGEVELGIGVAFWGLHMGLTQGLLSAMVADSAPPSLRGTAFGVFYAVSGLALLLASAVAGALWDALGAPIPFAAGAALAALSLLLLPFVGPRRTPKLV